jgi:hypothetical protein
VNALRLISLEEKIFPRFQPGDFFMADVGLNSLPDDDQF